MRLGITGSLALYEQAAVSGFDFFEVNVVAISKLSQEEWENFLALKERTGFPCETACVLFPGDIKLVGPDFDLEKIKNYLTQAFSRLAALGVEIVVLGSGGARKIPDSFDVEKAKEQFAQACLCVARTAQTYHLQIALEPLNQKETNVINTVSEGYEWVKRINHANFNLLADAWHMANEKENSAVLQVVKDKLIHAHTAGAVERKFSGVPGEKDHSDFFYHLQTSGYTGRLTLEGNTSDFENNVKIAIQHLRNQFKNQKLKKPSLAPMPALISSQR